LLFDEKMKTLKLLSFAMILLLQPALLLAQSTGDITTVSGKRYFSAKIIERYDNAVKIEHTAGITYLNFRELTDADRQRLGLPTRADLDRQKREHQLRLIQNQKEAERHAQEQRIRQKEVADKQRAFEKMEIDSGLVKFRDQWITPDEVSVILSNEADNAIVNEPVSDQSSYKSAYSITNHFVVVFDKFENTTTYTLRSPIKLGSLFALHLSRTIKGGIDIKPHFINSEIRKHSASRPESYFDQYYLDLFIDGMRFNTNFSQNHSWTLAELNKFTSAKRIEGRLTVRTYNAADIKSSDFVLTSNDWIGLTALLEYYNSLTDEEAIVASTEELPPAQSTSTPIAQRAKEEARGFQTPIVTEKQRMMFAESGLQGAERLGYAPVKPLWERYTDIFIEGGYLIVVIVILIILHKRLFRLIKRTSGAIRQTIVKALRNSNKQQIVMIALLMPIIVLLLFYGIIALTLPLLYESEYECYPLNLSTSWWLWAIALIIIVTLEYRLLGHVNELRKDKES